ncbi:MAG: hypothetical protein HYT07_02015 [Candidatus Levybacteria bacterium]|nr:hypothetical protein [Candidatus Levybacteria bacterium]
MGYLAGIVGLFFYSFTQIDLGLTLSEWSIWQAVQKFFQNIGYFQRPLSSFIFTLIILILFLFYILILWAVKKNKFTKRNAWFLIASTSIILTFSYNAFSYDLFNYIFDAKIITYYHQNPYFQKALDYPNDPMLSFMHWTHRTYPYGPVWLLLTAPLSLGIQFFLPTFFLFKTLTSLSFLGTTFFIGKILNKVSPKDEILGTVFFALNPLVIVESLVSAHNDITMIFFALFALYLIIDRKYIRSFILLFISIGVKIATIFLLPIFVYILLKVNKKLSWQRILHLSILMMVIAIVLASYRTNFQPWYLLFVLPFVALSPRYYFVIPGLVFSLVSLLQYLPFLYTGNWNEPIPSILSVMVYSSVFLSLFSVLFFRFAFLRRESDKISI